MAEPTNAPVPPESAPTTSWAKATMWMVIVLVLTVNAVIVLKSCRDLPGETLDKTGKVIDKASSALSSIAAAFKQGTITTSFVTYATTVTNHQRLQVSTLKEMAVFTETNSASTGFGYIPLPDVVVEARAPVEYTYYLDLDEPWRFVLQDGVVHAFAPKLRFNRPSVDASGISYEVRKGSFKTGEALDGLKRSITSLVTMRAKDNIHLVRESSRKETEAFIEKWLMHSFSDGKAYPVKVFFDGDKLPPGVKMPGVNALTNDVPR